MTIGRPARHRAPIETTQDRKGKATLVRKRECRPFHPCLVFQALSHPRATVLFDRQRRVRPRATEHLADGEVMNSFFRSRCVKGWLGACAGKQPFLLTARFAALRTSTADLFTWHSRRRRFQIASRARGPDARTRTAARIAIPIKLTACETQIAQPPLPHLLYKSLVFRRFRAGARWRSTASAAAFWFDGHFTATCMAVDHGAAGQGNKERGRKGGPAVRLGHAAARDLRQGRVSDRADHRLASIEQFGLGGGRRRDLDFRRPVHRIAALG
jgi:hypothetical protein